MLPIALALAGKFIPDIVRYMTDSATAGSVAGKVIDIAKEVTGQADPDAAAAAVSASPEMTEAFRQAVMDNDTELQRLAYADVASARDRDVKIVQATGRVNCRADWMLLATFVALVALVLVMLLRDIDANTAVGGVIILMVGKFLGNWEAAFNFEFGTTKSSKAKDDTIASLSNNATILQAKDPSA